MLSHSPELLMAHLLPHLTLWGFTLCQSYGCDLARHCGFDAHQLIASRVEHLRERSLGICVPSSINCLPIPFVRFLIGDLSLLICIWRHSLYILISKCELLCALQNFLPVGGISFINLWVLINSILLGKKRNRDMDMLNTRALPWTWNSPLPR